MTWSRMEPTRVTLPSGRSVTAIRAGMHAMAEIRLAFPLDPAAAEVNMAVAAVLNEHAAVAGQGLRRLGAELVVSNDADWLYVAVSTSVETLASSVREVRALLAFVPDEEEVRAAAGRTALAVGLAVEDLAFIADAEANATIYGEDHPYGRRIDPRALSAMTPTAMSDALHAALSSCDSHAVIAVDGDLHEGVDILTAMLASLPSEPVPRRSPALPPSPSMTRRDLLVAGSSRAQLRLLWLVPSPDRTPPGVRELIAADLGGDQSSRLFREVRERRGLCYAIRCRIVSARYSSACVISTSTTADSADAAMESIIQTVSTMIASPPDDARVKEVDRRLRLARAIATSTPRGIADRLLREKTQGPQGTALLAPTDVDAVAAHLPFVLSPSTRLDVVARGSGGSTSDGDIRSL